MILWRITRRPYADLSGIGGELFDARWHTRGRRIVYCAGMAALAALEVRVHLDLPPGLLPDDYVLMRVQAPDDLHVGALEPEGLPAGWRENETLCRPFGDAWLREAESALLSVPSAILDVERNVLLNPSHPDAGRIRVEEIVPFLWDERLFRP